MKYIEAITAINAKISKYNALVLSTDSTQEERDELYDSIVDAIKKLNKDIFNDAHNVRPCDAVESCTYIVYGLKVDESGKVDLKKGKKLIDLFRIGKTEDIKRIGKGKVTETARLYTIAMHRFMGACAIDMGANADSVMDVHAENLRVQENGKRAKNPYSNNSLSEAVNAIIAHFGLDGVSNSHYTAFVKSGCVSIARDCAGNYDEKKLSAFAKILDSAIIKIANNEPISVRKLCADMPKVKEANVPDVKRNVTIAPAPVDSENK